MKKLDFSSQLRNYAFRLLKKRSWAKGEFRQRLTRYLLKKKGLAEEDLIDRILRELEENGLLDDREFASLYLRHSLTFRRRGKEAIKRELRRRGVGEEIIEEVLAGREREEEEVAKDLIKRYQKRYEMRAQRKGLTPKEKEVFLKEKLREVLLRRGFSGEMIRKILREDGS
ncbi:MAG: regulatory protein RecX [candidate division WOR-3 bacterium]